MSLVYAKDDTEAEKRFSQYKEIDPFPSIPPSLLNGADIADYVAATGMVHPFYPEKLKSGSYEARIHGTCYCWDEDGKPYEERLEKDSDRFELKPNSLVYVQVEPTFRLPDYMALRFNLKISHVHRGILLGTGPLIDPGFEGKLLIPLHNFSNNSYMLKGLEALIWIEFTKLSPIVRYEGDEVVRGAPTSDALPRRGEYKPFPDDKKGQLPDYYFAKAAEDSLKAKPVFFSSVREIYRDTANKIKGFNETISRYKKIGWGALAAISVTIAAALYSMLTPTWSLINDVYNAQDQKWNKLVEETRFQEAQSNALKAQLEHQQEEIKALKEKIELLSAQQSVHPIKSNQSKTNAPSPKPKQTK
ncbi:hypothetical protein FEF65_08815 [Mariprofundus erugo]|uniref:dUTPase-like domain-containing protein n=1 Tax=Mariprofundus erugo TaxID=2528639 RepID=A0A5R9GQ38_9PROT|nr:hypothetical protein [Mariprofundus erugo]TLS67039.1 hypothetical protein FEF65_08815 [Mariprofundus erugo]